MAADEIRAATDDAVRIYLTVEDDDVIDALVEQWKLSRTAVRMLFTDVSVFLSPFIPGGAITEIGTSGHNPRTTANLVTAAAFRRNQITDTAGFKGKQPATIHVELSDAARFEVDFVSPKRLVWH
ncbi:hypothetical protein ABT215_30155 [Streptomyces sp900105755]|uniref:hypothetical protein n=1 Tax=Streptomyces sp. 900105755 TaxID=3154389 RepID=UPI0033286CC9